MKCSSDHSSMNGISNRATNIPTANINTPIAAKMTVCIVVTIIRVGYLAFLTAIAFSRSDNHASLPIHAVLLIVLPLIPLVSCMISPFDIA